MELPFTIAALWVGLAVIATIIAYHIRISMALVEICVGMVAEALWEHYFGQELLGANVDWLRFLASTGAVLLTFLAGAELDPEVIGSKWKEVTIVGLIGFLAPFLGCTALAHYGLGWTPSASLLAGVALSTTSMAVVYAVMLETGFNNTEFGKGILGACFVNDLGTVIALGLIFAPFSYKTFIFIGGTAAAIASTSVYIQAHHPEIRPPDSRHQGQVDTIRSVRSRSAGSVVRQRSGIACLPGRDRAGRIRR